MALWAGSAAPAPATDAGFDSRLCTMVRMVRAGGRFSPARRMQCEAVSNQPVPCRPIHHPIPHNAASSPNPFQPNELVRDAIASRRPVPACSSRGSPRGSTPRRSRAALACRRLSCEYCWRAIVVSRRRSNCAWPRRRSRPFHAALTFIVAPPRYAGRFAWRTSTTSAIDPRMAIRARTNARGTAHHCAVLRSR